MTIPERIAELTRDLPSEKQAEVLDFVEFLRTRRPAVAVRRGSLEALHAAVSWDPPVDGDEPDWSPLDVEPAELGDVEADQ